MSTTIVVYTEESLADCQALAAQLAAEFAPAPLIVVDPTIEILARAICDRLNALVDLDRDHTIRNRCRWWALVDAEESFEKLYGLTPWDFLGV